MKVIENQEVERLFPPTKNSACSWLDKIGRTCYRSEPDETKAVDFLTMIFNRGHWSVFEHLWCKFDMQYLSPKDHEFLSLNKFVYIKGVMVYMNLRTMVEILKSYGSYPHTLKFSIYNFLNELGLEWFVEQKAIMFGIYPPIEIADTNETYTFDIYTDRGVTHEFVRHRKLFSYSQESTRYCNYGKDKFGSSISYMLPVWFKDKELLNHAERLKNWEKGCREDEKCYFRELDAGGSPQTGRQNLNNSLATKIVVTAPIQSWNLFLSVRTDEKTVHPQMLEIAMMIKQKIFPVI